MIMDHNMGKSAEETLSTKERLEDIRKKLQTAFSEEIKDKYSWEITNIINDFLGEKNIDRLIERKHFAKLFLLASLFENHAKPTQKRALSQIQNLTAPNIDNLRQIKKLEKQLLIDPLTGMLNRQGILQAIEYQKSEMERYNRDGEDHRSFAVLALDLNGFKAINDNFGHPKGDDLLKEAARRIKTRVAQRHTDALSRTGGDEFLLVLPYDSKTEKPERFDETAIREKIHNALKGLAVWDKETGKPYLVATAIGVAFYDGKSPPPSTEKILKDADDALYADKGQNKAAQMNAARQHAYETPEKERDYARSVKSTSAPEPRSPEGPTQS